MNLTNPVHCKLALGYIIAWLSGVRAADLSSVSVIALLPAFPTLSFSNPMG